MESKSAAHTWLHPHVTASTRDTKHGFPCIPLKSRPTPNQKQTCSTFQSPTKATWSWNFGPLVENDQSWEGGGGMEVRTANTDKKPWNNDFFWVGGRNGVKKMAKFHLPIESGVCIQHQTRSRFPQIRHPFARTTGESPARRPPTTTTIQRHHAPFAVVAIVRLILAAKHAQLRPARGRFQSVPVRFVASPVAVPFTGHRGMRGHSPPSPSTAVRSVTGHRRSYRPIGRGLRHYLFMLVHRVGIIRSGDAWWAGRRWRWLFDRRFRRLHRRMQPRCGRRSDKFPPGIRLGDGVTLLLLLLVVMGDVRSGVVMGVLSLAVVLVVFEFPNIFVGRLFRAGLKSGSSGLRERENPWSQKDWLELLWSSRSSRHRRALENKQQQSRQCEFGQSSQTILSMRRAFPTARLPTTDILHFCCLSFWISRGERAVYRRQTNECQVSRLYRRCQSVFLQKWTKNEPKTEMSWTCFWEKFRRKNLESGKDTDALVRRDQTTALRVQISRVRILKRKSVSTLADICPSNLTHLVEAHSRRRNSLVYRRTKRYNGECVEPPHQPSHTARNK